MTKTQGSKHKIGIVFLVLALLCAGVYVWLGFEEARLAMPELSEDTNPMGVFMATAAAGAMMWFCVMGSLFSSLLGASLSLGTLLLCATKPWKIAGGVGIALHIGLLIAFFVRYGDAVKNFLFFL